MAMSRDRVKFFVGPRYFGDSLPDILSRAFGGTKSHWRLTMEDSEEGLMFVCRPSQFARFIVHRHDLFQGVNGVKDLAPELISEEEAENITRRNRESMIIDGVPGHVWSLARRKIIRRILEEAERVEDRLLHCPRVIDVSTEPAALRYRC